MSQHTSSKDLREKFDVYEEVGVKGFWVVHPQEQTALVYTLNFKGKFEGTLTPYVRTDRISSTAVEGLILNLEEVFPNEEAY